MTTNTRDDLPELLARLSAWHVFAQDESMLAAPVAIQSTYEKASNVLSNLKANDIDPWLGLKIHSIIRKSTRFIVYLDEDLEVQWWWLVRPNETVVGAVQARINQLTHESAFLLEEAPSIKSTQEGSRFTREAENVRSAIGEAMAVALNNGSQADCDRVLAEAARFIAIAKDQRCRPVFLMWFIIAVVSLFLLAISGSWVVSYFEWERGALVMELLQSGAAGAFGALISVMTRTKDLGLEPAAGSRGLRIDAFARATIGVGAGVLMYLAFEGGVVLKEALQDDADLQLAIRLFMCIAAGASERILPSLVQRADALVNGKSESATTETKKSDESERKPASAAAEEAVG